jgi:peroxygenase
MAQTSKRPDSLFDDVRHAIPSGDNGDVNANPRYRKLNTKLGKDVNEYPLDKPYNNAIDTVPATIERMQYIPSENDKLVDPGTARASVAADVEHPHGTTDGNWAERHKSETMVQQHCAYFDQDGDGVISPRDTYTGCRNMGWGIFLSAFAAYIINVNLSYPTQPSWVPDPLFRIYTKNIHKNKHGSDSMSYDCEGRFMPQKFEDIFAKYDKDNKGGLDRSDLARFHKGQRMTMDFFGWSATFLECKSTITSFDTSKVLTTCQGLGVYLLLWPEDGVLRKDDVRRVFDGSIFEQKAQEHSKKSRGSAK